ncbi:ATP-binding protein [Actinoplanes sp. HUAS TT8]|uniref:ATP-binding protein n=1 Tax=Actinoplanes sp. HUAS TT8 TaxID=3447453 RepID=UPI003F528407
MTAPASRPSGHDKPLRQAEAVLAGAREGAGGSVFVRGESGVGRSRLLAECGRVAAGAGMVVLRGRASVLAPSTPFRPLTEALMAFARTAGPDVAATLGPYRVILGRLIPEWREPGAVPDEQPLIVLAEGVLRLLGLAGRERGCLLVLDDLQAADPETLTIVEYLADNLAGQPVALVASLLDHDSPALDLAGSAARRGAAGLVDLGRFDQGDLSAFVASRLECPAAEVPDDVLDLAWRVSAGNPSLAADLLADLIEGELLGRDERGWRLARRLTSYVPGSLSRRVARRLQGCEQEPRRLLLAAAVFGERAPRAALRAMTGLGEEELSRRLHAGLPAELMRADSQEAGLDWCSFRHPMTAGALLDTFPSSYRVELSRQAAEAVEALDPGLPGVLCQLVARLRTQAGDRSIAARHLLEAARRALTDGAAASAVDLLEQAVALAGDDAALRADISEQLVQALVEAGQVDRALAMVEQFDRLDRELGRSRMAALHTRLAWAAVFAASTEVGLAQIDAARRRLGDHATPAELAAIDVVAAHLVVELPGRRNFDLAEGMARRAAAVAERSDLPVVACQAWQLLGSLLRQRDIDEATACLERSRRLAIGHGLRLWEIHALVRLGNDDAARDGDLRRLRQVSLDARAAGAVTAAYQAEASAALQLALQGGYDEAARMIDSLLPAATRLRLVETAGHLRQTGAVIAAHQSRRREMDQAVADLRRSHGESPWADAKVFGLARAFCSLLEENRERALDDLRHAAEANGGNPAMSPLNGRFGLHLLLRALAGDLDEAALGDGAALLRWNHQFALMARAVLAGRRGDRAAAGVSAAAAIDAAAIYPMARNLVLRLGAEAALADGWGDPVAWLREAEEYFHRAETAAVAGACRAMLRRAGVSVGQRRDGRDAIPGPLRASGVTVREYEILGLLAVRLSNREIAEQLHLSPRTVEKHVARLMAKTGRTDRASLRELHQPGG